MLYEHVLLLVVKIWWKYQHTQIKSLRIFKRDQSLKYIYVHNKYYLVSVFCCCLEWMSNSLWCVVYTLHLIGWKKGMTCISYSNKLWIWTHVDMIHDRNAFVPETDFVVWLFQFHSLKTPSPVVLTVKLNVLIWNICHKMLTFGKYKNLILIFTYCLYQTGKKEHRNLCSIKRYRANISNSFCHQC